MNKLEIEVYGVKIKAGGTIAVIGATVVAALVVLSVALSQASNQRLPPPPPAPTEGLPSALLSQCQGSPRVVCRVHPFMPPSAKRT